MSSFFAGLFGGKNDTLNKDIDQSGAISSFGTGVGEADVTAANKFDQALLSGDPTVTAEALAPEISGAQTRAQQQKLQGANFGTRSGGTAAANEAADADLNTSIFGMEGGLKSQAASTLGSLGISEQNLGISANAQQAQQSQQRMENNNNSILGKAITEGVSAAESAGLKAALPTAAPGAKRSSSPFGFSDPAGSDADNGFAETVDQAPTGFFNDAGEYVGGVSPI